VQLRIGGPLPPTAARVLGAASLRKLAPTTMNVEISLHPQGER